MFKVSLCFVLVAFHALVVSGQEAVFLKDDCTKDVEEGPIKCHAYIPVYKWDNSKQACVPAVYGGCHKTRNNFQTKEECEKFAAPVCKPVAKIGVIFLKEDCAKDVEEGPIKCKAYIPVFKWDDSKQACVSAVYGGCNKTRNNFQTKEECEKFAAPVCKPVAKIGVVFLKEDCVKDVEEGPIKCKAYIPVFKWDNSKQACVPAVYGGCHKTRNNFQTKEECEKFAAPVCKPVAKIGVVFLKEDCVKDVEEGPIKCNAYIPVFKWDNSKQACVPAVYGGCHKTRNNFQTKEECEKFAAPVCKPVAKIGVVFLKEDCVKDVEEGPIKCNAYIPVFKWDNSKQACVPAVYGGCHKTRNNFQTKEECEKLAAPVCKPVAKIGVVFLKEDCVKDVEEGPIKCNAYIPVFKWDNPKQVCVPAVYGGCHKTRNNFQTKEECEKFAAPVCKPVAKIGVVFLKEDCVKDVEEGPIKCNAYIPVFKWDNFKQACVPAVYGGCHKTRNNFETKEECEKFAAPVCKPVAKIGVVFLKEDCKKGVESSPSCRGRFPVYTWDHTKKQCVEAIYGGCHATHNNFVTLADCERIAAPLCRLE